MNGPEEWRDIPGEPGYQASSEGRIRSLKRGAPRVLRLQANTARHGYLYFGTSHGRDVQRCVAVHSAVAAAFLGVRPKGLEVRHLDGDVTNNTPENLAYGTHAENEADKYRHGTRMKFASAACRHGHPYDESNTRWSGGVRYCKACGRERYAANSERLAREARERRARKRALEAA